MCRMSELLSAALHETAARVKHARTILYAGSFQHTKMLIFSFYFTYYFIRKHWPHKIPWREF